MNIAPSPVSNKAVEWQKAQQDQTRENSASFLAQAGTAPANGSGTAMAAAAHRRLLEEMKQGTQSLGFSTGEFLSNIGQNFNPDAPLHPRQALGMMMLAYEEGVTRFEAGDPQVSLRNLTELSTAVNEHLTSIQNGSAKNTAHLAEFGAGVAGFVRSMSVGVAAGIAGKIGGPPLSALVGGLTSFASLAAMAGSAQLHGVPLEQLDLPAALINDAGNLLSTIGAPHLMAFFKLPVAPTANTMRAIAMHAVQQGGVEAGIDSLFVAFTEAAFKNQPIPDALRAGAVQGVFSFLTAAGIAGAVGRLDAVKSDNLGKMIEALGDSDAERLMSQFSPTQADALRKENPIVYRALNGRTDGALDEMLNSNPRGAQNAPDARELELVEVGPGEYGRPQTGSMAATASEVEGLSRQSGESSQPGRQNRASGASLVGQMPQFSSPDNPNVLNLGGDEFVISERKGKLIVTVPGGDDFTFPEGMTVEEARRYFEDVWLTGVLPDNAAPRNPLRLGDEDFSILGAEGLFGIETPRGEFHRFEGRVGSLDEAAARARNAWFNGGLDGYGPPRTTVNVAGAELVIVGGGRDPYFLKQADGVMIPLAATSQEEAVLLAGQRWLRGAIPGSPPPVSRLTLDAETDQAVTILGGGRGPFALGDSEGRYITDLASQGSNTVTSLDQASEMVKEAWGSGLLDSFGLPGPLRASPSAPVGGTGRSAPAGEASAPELQVASGTASTLSGTTANFPNPTNLSAVLRFTEDDWGDRVADLPPATREAMRRTVEMALERSNEWESAPLERALRVLNGPRSHPDPKDPLAVAAWVEQYWPDQLADHAPREVLVEMASTLYDAMLSTDPSLRWNRNRILNAMDALRQASARAFPPLEDVLSGAAPDVSPEKYGVPRRSIYSGTDTDGNPVFETTDGRQVGPFGSPVGSLETSSLSTEPAHPEDWVTKLRESVNVRLGVTVGVRDQVTRSPIGRATLTVDPNTVDTIREARRPRAEGERTPTLRETLSTAFGLSFRKMENLHDLTPVRNWLLGGFGTMNGLQFKTESLNAAAIASLRGESTGFRFRPVAEDPVELTSEGGARIMGRLSLDVTEVPSQTDVFGSDTGRKFRLNSDLTVDKSLQETYVPLFGEYREESNGAILIPAGSVLPEDFVQIVNRRVRDPRIAVTVPGDFSDVATAEREVNRALAGTSSFIRDASPEAIEAELIGGTTPRVSSVPGKPFEGPNRLDVPFRPEESAPNHLVKLAYELLGREPPVLPFERSVYGTPNVVETLRPNEYHGWDTKVRFKFKLPIRLDVGPAKLSTAFYFIREAQPDLRTHLMTSNQIAHLGFSDDLGHPRQLDIPTWLATMVSAGKAPGELEAQLGLAQFPAGGIIIPPGGTDSLRGLMIERFQDGTPAQREAITTFLDMYMSGDGAAISDGRTLRPSDRDELINVLYMIADPVQALPGD